MSIISYYYYSCRENGYGMGPDPLWTESNWPDSTPFLELYLEESSATEYVILAVGLAVTVVSCIVVGAVKFAWEKRQKID